jgi:hypothetical protein
MMLNIHCFSRKFSIIILFEDNISKKQKKPFGSKSKINTEMRQFIVYLQ